MAGRSANCQHVIPLEVTMHDPFFFDRLMHAFTTVHSTPLSHAATHAATGRPTAEPTTETARCPALRQAEEVVAAALLQERTVSGGSNQPDDHAIAG
jgi:hypothetical protein